jgi:hypothetical protein
LTDAPQVAVVLRAPIARTFAAVVDARHYPEWLVGAQHIRSVDPEWPAPGSGFDHVVGVGLLRLEGRTTCAAIDPPHHLLLEAGIGPLGSMLVSFDLAEAGDEAGEQTSLAIAERPHTGVVRRIWSFGGSVVIRRLLWGRNRWSVGELSARMGIPTPVEV